MALNDAHRPVAGRSSAWRSLAGLFEESWKRQRRRRWWLMALAAMVAVAAMQAFKDNVGTAYATKSERVTVSVRAAGGFSAGSTPISGTVVFKNSTGHTTTVEVGTRAATITLPRGKYQAYATSPQYDSANMRCRSGGSTNVTAAQHSFTFRCQE
jgi:hypothetical protein